MRMNILLITALFFAGCGQQKTEQSTMQRSAGAIAEKIEFKDYWYGNEAELCHYELEQARYGEIRKGDVVLVFVTEPLGDKSHVKNDDNTGGNSVPVLKLNYVKKFTTGIYGYSMMSSIFTPVDQSSAGGSLRVTTTSQEWCGHTYMSMDLRENEYEILSRSYFENEADQQFSLKKTWLEDELFNVIRLAPEKLPIGEFEMIPSTMYSRLMHVRSTPYSVKASSKKEGNVTIFTVIYPELDRELSIHYKNEFPYKIMGWEETYVSGFGSEKRQLTTKATLTHTRLSPYWTENAVDDAQLRNELGL